MKKELEPFYRSLRRRGLNQAALAARVGMNRSVLARVLLTKPGTKRSEGKGGDKERGKETRGKVAAHLTWVERALLGWELGSEPGENDPATVTPPGVEQCSM